MLTVYFVCATAVQSQLFSFADLFSIVQHSSTQRRTPAPRGMASQHLPTFERVPAAYSLFAGNVPTFNLFQIGI